MPEIRSAAPLPTVLFCALSVYGRFGGIQRFNQRIIDAARDGTDGEVRLLVLSLADGGTRLAGRIEFIGCGNSRVRFLLRYVLALVRERPALVLYGHVNLIWLAMLARLLRPRAATALFAHGVEVWNAPGFRRRQLADTFLLTRMLDRIICVSRYTAALATQEYRLDSAHVTELSNSVDLGEGDGPAMHLGSASGCRLLSVARLEEADKGIGQVIAAIRHLRFRFPTIEYIIIGSGPLKHELEALARAIGVSDRVHFLGSVPEAELGRQYRESDLFVLPSKKEGFGIVYLEAWKYGLPVICGKDGASSEVVIDGESGLVVDTHDIPAIAAAIERLLSEPAFARQLARNGFGRLVRHYTFATFRRNFFAIVRSLLTAPRTAPEA